MNVLRGINQHVIAWLFTIVALGSLIVLLVLTLGFLHRFGSDTLLRFWGRGMLFIAGVKLDTRGMESLREQGCRVLIINHTSTLDLFIVSALAPKGAIHITKKEFFFVPLIGQAAWLLRVHFIDRSNNKRAIHSLEKAAIRMKEEQGTVFIAPEGTRSKDGSLQPFKLGAFHLAMSSGASIYPVFIENAYELWPRSSWYSHGGTLRLRLLDPIDSSDFTKENLREKAEQARKAYLDAQEQTA
jgi:1-acyl-sn-glycerol-3-phosphate acyltransferase